LDDKGAEYKHEMVKLLVRRATQKVLQRLA
jgi:hypothetical protein